MAVKVSIIVPCYNVEKYVEECLLSIYEQTYKDYEVILINDGSTDNTEKILIKYLNKYPNVTQYIYQKNSGLSSARNAGIINSKGLYICFIDSDDKLTKDSVLKRVEVLEKDNSISLVYSNSYIIQKDGIIKETMKNKVGETYSGLIFHKLLDYNFIIMPTVMIRSDVTKLVGMFDSNLKRVEDYELWLRISYYKKKFQYIDDILAYYRIREDSLSSNLNEMDLTIIQVYKSVLKKFNLDNKEKERIKKNINIITCNLNLRLQYYYISIKSYKEARLCLIEVIKSGKRIKYILKYFLLLVFPIVLNILCKKNNTN